MKKRREVRGVDRGLNPRFPREGERADMVFVPVSDQEAFDLVLAILQIT